jgi:hypothetical protein
MILRSWLPLISKEKYFKSDSFERGIETVIITLRQKDNFTEKMSLTTVGFSKRFEVSVIFETLSLFGKEEDSIFYNGEISIIAYENAKYLITDDSGFIVKIKCMKEALVSTSMIELICTKEGYEFLQNQLKINKLITLSADNCKKFNGNGMEEFLIRGRKIDINLEDTYRSTNSLKRFIKRYEKNPDLLKNSSLIDWLEHYKCTV